MSKVHNYLYILVFTILSVQIGAQTSTIVLHVKGNCNMCTERIEKTAEEQRGVESAMYFLEEQLLYLEVNQERFDLAGLEKQLANVGHDTENFKASDEIYQSLPGCCRYDRGDSEEQPISPEVEDQWGFQSQTTYSMHVRGNCGMCQERIEEAAMKEKAIISAFWDVETEILKLEVDPLIFSEEEIHAVISGVGHDTNRKRAPQSVYENLHFCCLYRDEDHKDRLIGMLYEKAGRKKKEALIGATVMMLGRDYGTVTDHYGAFDLPISEGDKAIVLSYVGYADDTLYFDKPGYVEIIMQSTNVIDGVELAQRRWTTSISYTNPIKTRNISEKELTKAACCNLSESFETTPSVDVSSSDAVTGTRTIEMLGLAGPNVQITRENMPDIRGLSAMTGFTFVPGPWIESIQLSMGTGSVINGFESIAGQINVELKKPNDREQLYINAYYNRDNGRAEGNLVQNFRLSDRLQSGILLHYNQQKREMDHNNDGFMDMPLSEAFILANTWNYTGKKGHMAQAGFKYINSDLSGGQLDFDRNTPTDKWGMFSEIERFEAWMKNGKIFESKENTSIGIQASGVLHKQNSRFGNRQYDADQSMIYINGIYATQLGDPRHKISSGLSLQAEQYNESLESEFYERKEIVPGVFSEYTYTPGDEFTMVVGLRGDHHNNFGFFATPRVHFRYAPNQETVFRASAGRGQRTANVIVENLGLLASSRAWNIMGDASSDKPYGLNPEVAWNFGANMTREFSVFSRELKWSVDVYFTRFQNQIVVDLDRNPQEVHFYNLQGESYSNSFQTQLDYNPFFMFDVRLAYRFNDVRNTFSGELMERPLISRHRAFANIAYETANGWKFDYTINWLGSQRLPDTRSNPLQFRRDERSPSYFLSNAQISKAWGEKLEVYVGGENIFGFTQNNPIISASDPWSPFFDGTIVWGPIMHSMYYVGFRYKLFRE
jgi:outer membrane receptor for ferrienterochelin and colicins